MKSTKRYGNNRNNEQIEQLAVHTITDKALKYPHLQPRIQTTDKVLFWNGGIAIPHSSATLSGIVTSKLKASVQINKAFPTR